MIKSRNIKKPTKQVGIPISDIGHWILCNKSPKEANVVSVKAKPAKMINKIVAFLKIWNVKRRSK